MTRVCIDETSFKKIDSNKGLIKHVISQNIVYDYLYDAGLRDVQQVVNPDYLLVIDNIRLVNKNPLDEGQDDYSVDAFGFFVMYESLFMESLLKLHLDIVKEPRYENCSVASVIDGLWLSLYERDEENYYTEIRGPDEFVSVKTNVTETLSFLRNS